MKKSFFLTLILFFTSSLAFSEGFDLKTLSDNIHKTLATQAAYFDSSQGRFMAICGTSYFVEFNFLKDKLSTTKDTLIPKALVVIPRPTYGSRQEKTYDSPAGFFKIHYVTEGDSAVNPADVSPPDTVPDYVNKAADIFDSVWIFEVNTLRYTAPPSDSFYPSKNGGDGKFDVYLVELAPAYLGYTVPETTTGSPVIRYTSYIVIRNDYPVPPFPSRPIYDNVRVTAAHEFFHSIQFGYDVSEYEYIPGNPDSLRPYWQELSATWMEDMAYDYINDYLVYLPYFYNYPWLSLRTFSYNFSFPEKVFHPYASCVWAFYLQERYGLDIIRRIWEECGRFPGFNFLLACDSVLREFSGGDTGIAQAFTEFTDWNYFTGDRALPSSYYSEAALFGVEVKIDTLHPVTSRDTIFVSPGIKSNPPQNFAANYVVFVPLPQSAPDSIGGLKQIFYQGPAGAGWRISAIAYNSGLLPVISEFDTLIPGQWYDSIPNWASYDSVIMVPAPINFATNFAGWQYGYRVNYDSVLTAPSAFATRDSIFQNFPNPFVIRSSTDSTRFPFTLSEASNVFIDILTPDGNLVKRIRTAQLLPGNNSYKVKGSALSWDGKNEKGEYVASGVYFFRVKTKNAEKLMKLVVVRQ